MLMHAKTDFAGTAFELLLWPTIELLLWPTAQE
jgi:hypothetical protein